MNILAVDTSAKITSAAVISGGRLLADFNIDTKETNLTHSQSLMPMIESLLNITGLTVADMDGFACAHGPGSFTGLRIGIGAIKGLAYAHQKPCVGISTLHGLAYNMVNTSGIICPVMDARCKQVYSAIYENLDGNLTRLCEDMALPIDELLEKLKAYEKTVFFVGDGSELCYNNAVGLDGNAKFMLSYPSNRFQRAQSIGFAAIELFEKNLGIEASKLIPQYLRLPQAEREYNKRNSL